MEDYQLDIMIGQGPGARSMKLDLPKFTLVGATTRAGLHHRAAAWPFRHRLPSRLLPARRSRSHLQRSAEILGVEIDDAGAREIARRSRGTPRIANRLLRRVRDYAEVDYDGRITKEVADDALDRMEVDAFGLDEMDRKLLLTIIEKFNGGPVGLEHISASIHEENDSIEEIIEPYLIQIGFLDRTPRGRMATRLAYEHFGIDPPRRAGRTPRPLRRGLINALRLSREEPSPDRTSTAAPPRAPVVLRPPPHAARRCAAHLRPKRSRLQRPARDAKERERRERQQAAAAVDEAVASSAEVKRLLQALVCCSRSPPTRSGVSTSRRRCSLFARAWEAAVASDEEEMAAEEEAPAQAAWPSRTCRMSWRITPRSYRARRARGARCSRPPRATTRV